LPPDRLAALPAFARSIAPFPVVDSAGRAYDMPFLGGLDTPRPTLADIDGDGDLDLFIQEFSGSLMFFEQTAPGRFAWRADRYLDLDIGEWYRFADLDGDGDLDLMSELPFSYLRWWRNDGGPRAARITALPDSVRGTDGRPIFADRQNIAQLGDVDCDGKVDLLIGRVQGSVTRYELADFDSSGAPRFRLITDRFEDIEIVGQMVPGMTNPNPTMHGANTMALADLDGDGDQDLLWGDFFEPGLLLIENTGSCRELNLHGTPVSWPASAPIRTSGYNAPTVGDLDGDHSLDVLVGVLGGAFNPTTTAANNLLHLARTPAGWTLRTRRFLGTVDIGNESWPALADIDGDGDLDVLMANRIEGDDQSTGAMYLLTNTGTARAPAFRESGKVANLTGFQSAPAIADLDGDGDLDMITGSYGPALSFWRNDGTRAAPRFVLADSAVARIPRGSSTVPALADLDGDGDLDLVVGEAAGNLNVFMNTGSRTAPRFELAGERWQGVDATRRSAPTFADLDADGDMDLVVGAADGTLRAWRNDGPATAPVFTDAGVLVPPTRPYATPALGDLDGDRVPDLISGASGGGLLFFSGRRGG
jgi:hypothetical protein